MDKINKETKLIKLAFRSIVFIIMPIGLFFSFLIALLSDGPGFALIGSTITITASAMIYACGDIVASLKENTAILNGIKDNLNK